MNVHYLELFHHVARTGGITPALRSIPYGIQQPAVSSQISRLEEDLGVKLFHRRPFALTPEGRDLADFIQPFFNGLPEVEKRIRDRGCRRLRIGAMASILRDHLPNGLEAFVSGEPKLELELREVDQREAVELLREQTIDLALTELTAAPPSFLRHEVLIRVEPVLIVPSQSPFRRGSDLWKQPTDLPPLISLDEDEPVVVSFRRFLSSKNIHWPTRLRVRSADLVRIYCVRGFGVGLVARLPKDPPPAGFRYLGLPGARKINIGALWQPGLSPVPEKFLNTVRSLASQRILRSNNVVRRK